MRIVRFSEPPRPTEGENWTRLPVGTLAKGDLNGEYHIWLRIYDGIVSLTQPEYTGHIEDSTAWSLSALHVEPLSVGTEITLRQEDPTCPA